MKNFSYLCTIITIKGAGNTIKTAMTIMKKIHVETIARLLKGKNVTKKLEITECDDIVPWYYYLFNDKDSNMRYIIVFKENIFIEIDEFRNTTQAVQFIEDYII